MKKVKLTLQEILIMILFALALVAVIFSAYRADQGKPTHNPDGWYKYVLSGKIPYIGSDYDMRQYLVDQNYAPCQNIPVTHYQMMNTYDPSTKTFIDKMVATNISTIANLPCYTTDGNSIENSSYITIQGTAWLIKENAEFIRNWQAGTQ